jgi:DNA-binding NarL/FixJ family response regulator
VGAATDLKAFLRAVTHFQLQCIARLNYKVRIGFLLILQMIRNAVYKILLVEDSELIGSRILRLLSTLPHIEVIGQARTVAEGLFHAKSAVPDIVFLDINLPDGSGIWLLKELKIRQPHIRIIMLSNSSGELYRYKCMELGAEQFLDKTNDFPMILDIVNELVDRNQTHKHALENR